MIPSITAARLTGVRHRTELPLLVLGPSAGTSATTVWSPCAARLTDAFDLLAWDLPGQGHNPAVPDEPFNTAELAEGVLRVVDDVLAQRGENGGRFFYAGVSVGGDVGLQLLLDRPDRILAAALLGTRAGTESSVVRDRLSEIAVPVLAVAGSDDLTAPPEVLRALADGVHDGSYAELAGVAGPAPAEVPAQVAALLRRHFLGEEPPDDLTRELQELLTAHARGSIWTRPGLDPRSRSIVTLTALVVGGHHEELATQVRAARTHGLGATEIKEVILQTAIHCGIPDARTAFRIAEQVLAGES